MHLGFTGLYAAFYTEHLQLLKRSDVRFIDAGAKMEECRRPTATTAYTSC
jgi:hypothetical protein